MKATRKSTTLRVFAILLLCFLFWGGCLNVHAAKKMWAKLDYNGLTFYYTEKSSLGNGEYWVNTGSKEEPGWVNKTISIFTFDDSFKDARPTSCYRWFYFQKAIYAINNLHNLNTTQVTTMEDMFRNCFTLITLDLTSFNTPNLTNTTCMFANSYKLERIYVNENFKTDKVTESESMFSACTALQGNISYEEAGSPMNQQYANLDGLFTAKDLADRPYVKYGSNNITFRYGYKYSPRENEYFVNTDVNNWDTPGWIAEHKTDIKSVTFDDSFKNFQPTTTMSWFSGCENLTTIYNIGNLNTSSLEYAAGMFRGCKSLRSLDLSTFDTSKTWSFNYMFEGCSSLSSINVSSFNTSKVGSFCGMFQNCSNLRTIDVSNFTMEKAYYVGYMFAGCTNLQTIDISKFSVANVENVNSLFDGCTNLKSIKFGDFTLNKTQYMNRLFSGCASLTSLDLTTFSTENIQHMDELFKGCTKLQSIYVSDKFVTSAVTSSDKMFEGCTSLSGSIDFDASKPNDKTYASADGYFINRDYIRTWVKYENGTLSFQKRSKKNFASNEYSLNSNESNPAWLGNNGNVTKVVIDATFADVRPTSCYRWFDGCAKLTDENLIGLGNLNTSSVWTFRKMFIGCSSLKNLDLSKFDTGKAQRLRSLVENCTNLQTVSLPKMDNVVNIEYMLKNCRSLTQVDLSGQNTGKVQLMTELFYGCSNLKEIIGLERISTASATGMYRMFMGCSALTDVNVSNFNTAKVTNMASMFEKCKSLASLDLSNFNTANVTDMSGMFNGCTWLTSLNMKNFNTAKVTNMNSMFKDCANLPTLDISMLETSSATTLASMFDGCKKLTSIDVSNFNTGNATALNLMFKNCEALTSLDLKSFNTANVWEFSDFVWGCKNLKEIDLSSFNTENATNMGHMFADCSSLTKLNLESFNTVKVKYVDNMFNGCTNLMKIYATGKFTTGAVENGADMFLGCTSLKGARQCDGANEVDATYANVSNGYLIDKALENPYVKFENETLTFYYHYGNRTLGENEYALNTGYKNPGWYGVHNNVKKAVFDPSFADALPTSCYMWFYWQKNNVAIEGLEYLNTSEVTNMSCMFRDCENLKSIDVSHFNTENVTDMSRMFYECKNVRALDVSKFNTSKVNNMYSMFDDCWRLKSLDVSKFNTSNVASVAYMFDNCNSLETIDVSNFDTRNVTNMKSMFSSCSSLQSLNLANFNTENVTDMSNMFFNCDALKSLDLSNFNTSKVKNMYEMFGSCNGIKSLDLSMFDTQNVENMERMFMYSDFESLNLSNFNTSKVKKMSYMFYGCKKLNEIIISDFSTESLTNSSEMLTNCPTTVYCSVKEAAKGSNSVFAANTMSPYVSITSNAEYGTLCVPVGGTLAEGGFSGFDKLYTVDTYETERNVVKLKEATGIEPGVPYIYRRKQTDTDPVAGAITFTADVTATATAPVNDGMLRGTFVRTTAPAGSYVLQTDGMFHPVAQAGTIAVGAYRAYLEIPGYDADGGYAKAFQLEFGDGETTGLDGIADDAPADAPADYYDLMGRRVDAPQKGRIYITRGKKVLFE